MNNRAVYELPWPPSANNSKIPVELRSKKTGKKVRRQVPTAQLKRYKKTVVLIARARLRPIVGIVDVCIDVYPPDRRRRDIANIEKAPVDALVQAGAIADDCLIDKLLIERHRNQPVPGGKLIVTIKPYVPEGALL